MEHNQWWRLVTPISTKWMMESPNGIQYMCYYKIYIFGVRIAKIQVNNPLTGTGGE